MRRESQVSLNECHFDEAAEVLCGFLETREDATGFFQPSDQALNDVPSSVGLAVEFHRTLVAVFVFLRGNDRPDVQVQQIGVDPISPVSFIATQGHRPGKRIACAVVQARVGAFEEGVQRRGLMGLPRSQVEVERMTMAVAKNMNFRRKTAARSA
jgi:hypothetical protein